MVLALSGDFNSEMVIPLIEQTFGKLRSGKIPDFPEFKEEPFNKRELVEKKLTPIKLGAIVFRSPREGDKDKRFKHDFDLYRGLQAIKKTKERKSKI